MKDFEAYISDLRETDSELVLEMEEFAKIHRIPIMDRSGMETFIGLLRIQRPKFILEIGSAIGYSAIRMVTALEEASVVTIERDNERHASAVEFINRSGLGDRITIIEGDGLLLPDESLPSLQYDALFIDAAKGQYKRFFEKYSRHIAVGGIIYCDNMFMHGAVMLSDDELPKRKRTMIRNLKEFTSWVMKHPDYETSLLPVGDGILVAVKMRD